MSDEVKRWRHLLKAEIDEAAIYRARRCALDTLPVRVD